MALKLCDVTGGTQKKEKLFKIIQIFISFMYFSDSVRYISTKSDGMRVNVKFNDFTVRKLKPNIFDNYQLIEAAAISQQQQSNHQQQQQQKSHIKDENDDHVTEGSPETGNTHFISFLPRCQNQPPF